MTRWLLFLSIALCVATASCSKGGSNSGGKTGPKSDGSGSLPVATASSLQWECQGGGGIRQCKVRSITAQGVGPFDMEFQAYDERGHMLGTSTVSIPGLGPGEEHEFTLTSSTRTRRVNVQRVIPR